MQRSQQEKKKFNVWKTAFWLLVILIIFIFAFLGYELTHTDATTQPASTINTAKIETGKPIFQVELTKNQTQRLANHYIKQYLNNNDIKYHLTVGKHVNLLGSAEFLGSNINFTLQTQPYPTTNGGIQLKAQRLKVGRLGIPLEFVMFYIEHNYRFPNWVKINSSKRLININLPAHQTKQGYYFKVDRLNLRQDKIIVKVYSTQM